MSLVPKLQAIAQARGGTDARIYVRGDKTVAYGTMMKVMGRLSAAGFPASRWSPNSSRARTPQ